MRTLRCMLASSPAVAPAPSPALASAARRAAASALPNTSGSSRRASSSRRKRSASAGAEELEDLAPALAAEAPAPPSRTTSAANASSLPASYTRTTDTKSASRSTSACTSAVMASGSDAAPATTCSRQRVAPPARRSVSTRPASKPRHTCVHGSSVVTSVTVPPSGATAAKPGIHCDGKVAASRAAAAWASCCGDGVRACSAASTTAARSARSSAYWKTPTSPAAAAAAAVLLLLLLLLLLPLPAPAPVLPAAAAALPSTAVRGTTGPRGAIRIRSTPAAVVTRTEHSSDADASTCRSAGVSACSRSPPPGARAA
jgi:hypothetical protein